MGKDQILSTTSKHYLKLVKESIRKFVGTIPWISATSLGSNQESSKVTPLDDADTYANNMDFFGTILTLPNTLNKPLQSQLLNMDSQILAFINSVNS